jgi:diguanylate cyclase (GGDEF)-like protein
MENETATPAQETTTSEAAEAAEATEAAAGSAAGAAVRRTVALLCVLAGVGVALLVAHSMAGRQEAGARRAFAAGAAAIKSSLNGSLRDRQALTGAASTFYAADANTRPEGFVTWANWRLAGASDPALQRIGIVAVVKHAQLRAFAARTGGHARSASSIRVLPEGGRPEYCLAVAEVVGGVGRPMPTGLDYCVLDRRLLATRGSGVTLERAALGSPGSWEALTPVYRGFAPPTGVAARNAAFVGWVREVIRPGVLLDGALGGHAGYAVQLRHGSNQTVIASAGPFSAGEQTESASLGGGWQAVIGGPSAAASLLGKGRAWVLPAGLLIGVLLGLATLLTGRKPERGWEQRAETSAAGPEPQIPEQEPLYDPLTGLPNRALTLDRADLVLARAGRQSGLLAGALLIDVDWFKDVNEKLGRQAGDQLLKIVAQRLQGVMRAEDTVGRLGDDRFVVLVECVARNLRLDALAQRVLEALHSPLELDGFGPSCSMTASIGVAFGKYDSAEALLTDTCTALEAAKADGKGCYRVFDAGTHSVREGRGGLEVDLGAAVQEQALSLVYEPIYDLQSRAVAGYEARPSWQHSEQGSIAPEDLLRLADDCGMRVPVDRWTIEQACARAAAWEVQGQRTAVSVRVGAEQLHRDGLITDLRRALQQSGVQSDLLTIEIAESAVMSDVALATQRLQEIKQLGVRLAIDDFGDSGYAYHSDLRKMPIDCLRVDRGALAVSDDPDYRNWLFEAILMVGRELSLTVIAKGVESEQQAQELQAMGCTVAQGPFLGQPAAPGAPLAVAEAPGASDMTALA